MNAIKFTSLSHLKWKSMMITDKAIVLSNKQYGSFESMAKTLLGARAMEDKEEFWYHSLDEMSFLENGENLTLKKINFRRDLVSTTINIVDIDIINELIQVMSQEEEFVRSEEKASTFSVAKASFIRTVVVGGFTVLMYLAAVDMASGKDVDTSGRRGFLKMIFVGIIDTIGATGVLLIGGGATLLLAYQLIQKLKNPPLRIRMKRVKK